MKRSRKVYADKTFAPATYKAKGSKNVKVRAVKKIKVSPKLKAKIKSVIDKKVLNIKGSVTDHYMSGRLSCIDRCQNVVGGCSDNSATAWHFTLPQFIDAASVLFNNKAPAYPGTTKYNLGSGANFDAHNIQFDIKNSYSIYQFKNNSQHEVHLTLVIGVPKRKGVCQEWNNTFNGQSADGTSVASAEAFIPLIDAWSGGLLQDYNNGFAIPGYSPTGLGSAVNGQIQPPQIQDIFRMPQNCKTLAALYKLETIALTMLPGQTVSHKLQGPRGVTIDMTKQTVSGVVQSVQRFSRNTCAILYNAQNAIANNANASGVLGGAVAGRWADKVDTKDAGFDVHVERTDHFQIVMPEQTGFTIPATWVAGNSQTLGLRRSKTNYNIYDSPKAAAPTDYSLQVVDLSVMNPQQPVAAGPGTGT